MFLCKKCIESEKLWLFDLAMGISWGKCEDCAEETECIDC